jgi:hypothetical protein
MRTPLCSFKVGHILHILDILDILDFFKKLGCFERTSNKAYPIARSMHPSLQLAFMCRNIGTVAKASEGRQSKGEARAAQNILPLLPDRITDEP